jgi:hypothetical protein
MKNVSGRNYTEKSEHTFHVQNIKHSKARKATDENKIRRRKDAICLPIKYGKDYRLADNTESLLLTTERHVL